MIRLLTWNLRHRRGRHVLDAVAMALTIAVVMLFVSVVKDLMGFTSSSSSKLTLILVYPKITAPGGDDSVPAALLPTLAAIDGVQVAQRYLLVEGSHPSGATYIVVGEEESGIELNQGAFPVTPDVFEAWKKEGRIGAIVGVATAKDLGLEVGKLAELPTSRGPLQVKVVGVSNATSLGHRVAVHYEYMRQALGNADRCQYRIWVKPDDYERVAHAIIERTANSSDPMQAVSESVFARSWAKRAAAVPAILGFLGAFLVLVTGLSLAQSRAIAIRERRIAIATMRVLGYRQGTLAMLLIGESVVIGLVGGAVAIAVMATVFRGGIQLTPGALSILAPVVVGPAAMVAGLIAAVVIPLVGTLPSVMAALRAPLATALRDSA